MVNKLKLFLDQVSKAYQGGGVKRIENQHKKGKLTARERIDILLDEKELDYIEIDIEEKGWNREDLFKKTGGRTVPQIVIEGETIGGYDDLIIMENQGKL